MKKYKVDFINSGYRRFFAKHKKEIVDAFVRCAKNGDFMLRDETRLFEKNLAEYVGTSYAVGMNSGTDAIFLSLKALDIGAGDEVITVSHTFIATIQAIVHTGAKPILVDVGDDELMDVYSLKRLITKKTKAIIPVHFHGKICDMERILEYDIPIIEDAAQALGATQGGKMAGSFGITGCFSFNFPKLMGAYGDAGAVTTNDEEVYKKLLLLRNHWNITQGSVRQDEYPQPDKMGWGWKSRIDNIQAAILNVKFKYLLKLLERRKEIGEYYDSHLEDLPIELPSHQDGEVIQEYIVKVDDNVGFKQYMDSQGIEVLVRDTIPNHKLDGLNLQHFHLPVTELIALGAVRLPCYPELTNKELALVVKAIKKYYGRS